MLATNQLQKKKSIKKILKTKSKVEAHMKKIYIFKHEIITTFNATKTKKNYVLHKYKCNILVIIFYF